MIKLVIFDCGDTVMRDFPQYAGPMADWPRVESMPGIAAALAALHPDRALAMATNAAESGAERVREALARVGLDGYFSAIVTARDIGVSKPDPAFFEAILAAFDCVPHQAVMVGDSFRTDIVGAKHASLHTVWYNAVGEAPPPDVPFRADAEIRDLLQLDAVIRTLDHSAEGIV